MPVGTCCRQMQVRLTDDDCIEDVQFIGGCHGNLQGIASLLRGMKREVAIARLSGIRCGGKETSCPDQLSRALSQINE